MWPTAFALIELTAAEEARIVSLVKKAVSCGLSNPVAADRASSSSIPAVTSLNPGANRRLDADNPFNHPVADEQPRLQSRLEEDWPP
jgi:hypothetical protein